MKPVSPTTVRKPHSISDLSQSIKFAMAFVASATPAADLRIVRPGDLGLSVGRNYASTGQFVDALTWAAIIRGQPLRATDYFASRPEARQQFQSQWLSRLGFAYAMAAPLAAPLFAGYPGALVALRTMDQGDFTEADLHALAAAAEAMDADRVMPQANRAGPSGTVTRLFLVGANGEFIGTSPAAAGLDHTLAENLVQYARERIRSSKSTSRGERLLLADSSGESHAFTTALYPNYPALGTGKILAIAAVPGETEWLALKPEHFAADEEIGRLLPALKFMKDEFANGITLPAISSHVHLSPFHFHRRFTELLGITPKHFLYDCQIAQAQEMLLASQHELEQIAKLCGFAHQSHFTSRFKQATGLTPTRWRRLKLGVAPRSATNGATARVN